MKSYDCVFLGNGATAIAVMNHYEGKPFKGKHLLITEPGDPQGAIYKGVKTVNLIVTKQPTIMKSVSAQAKYQSVITMLRSSEALLESTYTRFPAFQGSSDTGYRLCQSMEEFKVLQNLQQTGNKIDDSLDLAVVDFISKTMGHSIEKNKLFSYRERVWNVTDYINDKTDGIPQNKIWNAKQVELEESKGGGISLTVQLEDDSTETIFAKKVIVCKGAGNIQFEKNIIAQLEQRFSEMPLRILQFTKLIYEGNEQMPASVSSIMLPETGICVTNEAVNAYSLLYNTNASFITPNEFDTDFYNNKAQNFPKELREKYTALPERCSHILNCAMTIDPLAYSPDYTLHFKFIKSSSVLSNVYYLNLPYFSVIETALQNLPPHTKDFK
jgi:hypothetical protein